jgi:hypothetical protein
LRYRLWGNFCSRKGGIDVIGILIAVLAAAVVFWLASAIGLPYIVAVIAAILVLLAGIPTGGYGFGGRFGARRY